MTDQEPKDFNYQKTDDTSVSQLLAASWKEFQKRPNLLIGLGLLTVIPSAIFSTLMRFAIREDSTEFALSTEAQDWLDRAEPSNILFIISAFGLLAIIYNILVFSIYVSTFLHISKGGKEIEFAEAFKLGVSNFWRLALAGFVVFTIVGFGLILFIIPGIIFAFWFMYVFYLSVDKKLTIGQAMGESRRLFRSNRKMAVLFVLSVIGVSVLVTILFSIPMLILTAFLPDTDIVFSAIVEAGLNLFSAMAMAQLYLYVSAQASKSSSKS